VSSTHCIDDRGHSISVPSESVRFCPAVYGILIEDGKVMLTQNEVTGLWQPPGRMLANHETPAQALIHHFRRATGKIPSVGPLLLVEEQYRVDQQSRAWQLSVLYYAIEGLATGSPTQFSLRGLPRLELVDLNELKHSQMQFGFDAIQAGRLRFELL